jgi:hypothetical protein
VREESPWTALDPERRSASRRQQEPERLQPGRRLRSRVVRVDHERDRGGGFSRRPPCRPRRGRGGRSPRSPRARRPLDGDYADPVGGSRPQRERARTLTTVLGRARISGSPVRTGASLDSCRRHCESIRIREWKRSLQASRFERQALLHVHELYGQAVEEIQGRIRLLLARDLEDAVVGFSQVDQVEEQTEVAGTGAPQVAPHGGRRGALSSQKARTAQASRTAAFIGPDHRFVLRLEIRDGVPFLEKAAGRSQHLFEVVHSPRGKGAQDHGSLGGRLDL